MKGRNKPFVFGSSGFLYRSNKLMYDRQTHSLWNQFTGRPVVGKLTGSGIELKILPVAIATWGEWRARHPKTKVLSLRTGYDRNYSPGLPYGAYFASPDLMFPALTPDTRLQPKDYVFGLRMTGVQKAWPLSAFEGGRVLNDRVGILDHRAGGRRHEPHGARLPLWRPRLQERTRAEPAFLQRRHLDHHGSGPKGPEGGNPDTPARPHRVLVRLERVSKQGRFLCEIERLT